MKATGAQIKTFFRDGWPGSDWYWDYAETEVENEQGDFVLDLKREYDLGRFGYLCYQGDGHRDDWEFEDAFQKWQCDIDYNVYVVSIPKRKKVEFENFMSTIDGQYK